MSNEGRSSESPTAGLSQMELPIERKPEPDRNHAKGGRSFYFFDFDDNVAFLSTSIFLFEKGTGRELAVSTGEFAQWGRHVGKRGPFADFEVRYDDQTGSFRRFRDHSNEAIERFLRSAQPFIEDLANALGTPDFHWKGPSWSCFYHASFNQRPISVITARGHHPETIKKGIDLFVEHGHIPQPPNYLAIFPVSHIGTRRELGDQSASWSVASLKQAAIRASVQRAFEVYGQNPHHRFGMSDDDPHNLELITEEMTRLKSDFPENSFFIIETVGNKYFKKEVFKDHVRTQALEPASQLSLF
ncbi:MAG TPA: hypothetical protein VFV50_09045 [Bdellovibrionales bacterium]|nr:hypothetical protein [Bdellovibrionales bacterium]